MDWDEDLDLDADDMSEEEVKRIMENMAANKQETGNQEDADVDVSYFLFLLCKHCDPSLFLFSGLKNESCRCGESDLIHFFGANCV